MKAAERIALEQELADLRRRAVQRHEAVKALLAAVQELAEGERCVVRRLTEMEGRLRGMRVTFAGEHFENRHPDLEAEGAYAEEAGHAP